MVDEIFLFLFLGVLLFLVLITILIILMFRFLKRYSIGGIYFVFGFLITLIAFPLGYKSVFTALRDFFTTLSNIFVHQDFSKNSLFDAIRNQIMILFSDQLWYNFALFVLIVIATSYIISVVIEYSISTYDENQLTKRKKPVLKNALVIIIFIVALYLSISSIIAVPILSFQDYKESKYSQGFEMELGDYSKNDTARLSGYKQFIITKKNIQSSDTSGAYRYVTNFLNDFEKDINNIFEDIGSAKSRAISEMQTSDYSHIPEKLKLKHKSNLSTWYLDQRSRRLNYLDTKQQLLDLVFLRQVNEESIMSLQQSFLSTKDVNLNTNVPERPAIGSDLGVFNFFTGWLLGVESYSLAVIVGLIGFGLLGAGASTFIKEYKKGQKLLIDDLSGVLIKGFTAAIVVFLGVQGGLAVLTTDTPELNAYALFFLTFVAAVFSDDAWKWAKLKFGSSLGADDTDNGMGDAPVTTTPIDIPPPTDQPPANMIEPDKGSKDTTGEG